MKKQILNKITSSALVFLMVFTLVFSCGGDFVAAKTVPVNGGDDTEHEPYDDEAPDNGIPVLYLDIDETEVTIDDMHNSADHSVHCAGKLRIDAPDNFRYSDYSDVEYGDIDWIDMDIRGRGNSTWRDTPKKPYKIKLDKKTDLLQRGSEYNNKHWVLVANYFDQTFVKDRMTAWLADQMGFEFTPRGVPVDVMLSGSKYGTRYIGSYYLSENVRVDDNRLPLEELSENDYDDQKITGGYLVQNSLQVRTDSPDRFITKRGEGWATHTPSFDTGEDVPVVDNNEESMGDASEVYFENNEDIFCSPDPIYFDDEETLMDAYKNDKQQQYIQKHMQKVEDAIYECGPEYRDLIDINSTAMYWLVNEFSANHDAFGTGSTYIYKHRDDINGTVSKMMWGPVWDFDFAWYYDLDDPSFEINEGHTWMTPMFYDKEEGNLREVIKEKWPLMKQYLQEMTREGGILDGYCAETKASAEADRKIWKDELDPDRFDLDEEYDYEDHINRLKTWINARIKWMDANLGVIDNFVLRVQFVSDGKLFQSYYPHPGSAVYMDPGNPEKEGYVFLGWFDENGHEYDRMEDVTEDKTFTAKFIPECEATPAQDISFRKCSDVFVRNSHFTGLMIPYTVIPTYAQDKRVEWSSSDESFATIDNDGKFTFVDTGTGTRSVTFTARLKCGVERTYVVTLVDGECPIPESISPEKDVIYMTVGDQAAFHITTKPEIAKIDTFTYKSSDEKVVTTDEFETGYLTAISPGKTTVKVTTKSFYDDYEKEKDLSTYVTVVVLPEAYNVKFDMNGHGKKIADQKVKPGEKAKKPVNPTEAGYNFGGWYTTKDCKIETRYNWNSPVNKNLTLYAKWTIKTINMLRLYNPNSGEHFYTASVEEKNNLVRVGWNYEGVAWKAPEKSNTPVYRLYNKNAGDHHYTMNANEKDDLIKAGWNYEGIGWYSDDAKGVPLYRLYNPNAISGSHHYTVSTDERDILIKAGWKDEGIAWFGR